MKCKKGPRPWKGLESRVSCIVEYLSNVRLSSNAHFIREPISSFVPFKYHEAACVMLLNAVKLIIKYSAEFKKKIRRNETQLNSVLGSNTAHHLGTQFQSRQDGCSSIVFCWTECCLNEYALVSTSYLYAQYFVF